MAPEPITDNASLFAPYEGRRSCNALIDDVVELAHDQNVISFIKSTDPFEWQHVTGALLDRCIRAATAHYAHHLKPRQADQPATVVGLFADSSFNHWVSQMALVRLGYGAVLISPSNSVPAATHLVKTTGSIALLFGAKKADDAKKVRQALQDTQALPTMPLFDVEQLVLDDQLPPPSASKDPFRADIPYPQQALEPAFILHSSGSTGFPKPYTYTHEKYVTIVADYYPFDGMCTAPLYHGFACAVAYRSLMHRRHLYVFSETIRPDLVSEAFHSSTSEVIYGVPFTFKMLSEDKQGLTTLQRAKMCIFSGAPCPKEVGDVLVANGVNLVAFLGSTETGQNMDSIRDFDTDKEWNILRPTHRFAPHFKFENVGTTEEGPYELVVLPSWESLSKVNRPDGCYASGDHYRIVRRKDGSLHGYVYLGRGDDTLVHLTGEKTNPVSMEQTIRSSPLIRDCLVFGAGRPCTGAIIIPYEHTWEAVAHLSERERQDALKKQIEPLLREVNSECPTHSRLVPEMVRFASSDARFPVADKGSIKRAPANELFAKEIEQLYTDFDLGTSTPDEAKTLIESREQLLPLLKSILEQFLDFKLDGKEDIDLTHLGVDSVVDSQIRSKIHRSIRMPRPLPGTMVFQHPTLHKLTDAVFQHVQYGTADALSSSNQKEQHERSAYQILEKLRSQLKVRQQGLVEKSLSSQKEVVVLTGATGSLGAHIVDQLRRKPTVAKVICLNRANSHQDAEKRTAESLQTRGLTSIKANDSVQIISLASDISQPNLGLSQEEYDDLAATVTCVIHNGWPVNFVMSVDSFQPVLEGTVQLMNLAGQSAGCRFPRFVFSSSVSVALGNPSPVIAEEIYDNLDNTFDMGYAQSKWIVECLCRDAGSLIGGGFQSVVMRIGQMVGDRSGGIWNETEAPPLQIKSAQTIGCLPDRNQDLFWLPVDTAGLIAAQLTTVPLNEACVLVHVVSDEAMPWKTALETLAAPQNLGNAFEVVPYAEWVARLANSDQNPSRNPTIKLLDHFRATQHYVESGRNFGKFETTKLKQLFASSPVQKEVVEGLRVYKPEFLTTTVAAWKRSGFLH